MDESLALNAINELDAKLRESGKGPFTMLIGGGGAMLLGYHFKGATSDIDAILNTPLSEIETEYREVAKKLNLNADWINIHFSTFLGYLPADYESRIRQIFKGTNLIIKCLGPEDIAVMKFMAGRDKDTPHLRHLLKLPNINVSIIEERILQLVDIYGKAASSRALELFDELCGESGI